MNLITWQTICLFVVSAVHFAPYLTGLSSMMLVWAAGANVSEELTSTAGCRGRGLNCRPSRPWRRSAVQASTTESCCGSGGVVHASVLFVSGLQDRSIEKVLILVAIAKGKQLWIFIFFIYVAAGFLPRDVLQFFFRARV